MSSCENINCGTGTLSNLAEFAPAAAIGTTAVSGYLGVGDALANSGVDAAARGYQQAVSDLADRFPDGEIGIIREMLPETSNDSGRLR